MKKVLVLVANYPNNDGGIALMYVHTRNKYYVQHDIDVTVVNFATKKGYVKDGIKVVSLDEYEASKEKYDVLILHAANIRNHYKFLSKYEERFKHLIFFFHGHEVLKLNKTYPKPYDYMKTSGWLRMRFQDCYDVFKLFVWRKYLPKVAWKADFVFVSECFYQEFKYFTGLNDKKLLNHVHIINNSVGKIFEERSYNIYCEKKYDFITIRNMLDQSVYCIDLLCKLAEANPRKKFLLIGKGQYFEHNSKPDNIEWINKFLNHEEMLNYIDKAKCAIMLTRRDTQGVMSCELMAYGIPLITSDLPICKEIFKKCENVIFCNNDNVAKKFPNIEVKNKNKQVNYSTDNTILKEVWLIFKSCEC